MLIWPLLIVNLRSLALIWWVTTYFAQNNRTIILSGAWYSMNFERGVWRWHYIRSFGGGGVKTFPSYHFIQSNMVFGIINSFPWIFARNFLYLVIVVICRGNSKLLSENRTNKLYSKDDLLRAIRGMNDLPAIGYPYYAQRTLGSPGGKHC